MNRELWTGAALASFVAARPFLGLLKDAIIARIKWFLGRRY